jgi:signal transduction histidine kinase
MDNINQVSYLMFAAFTMGLAIKSYFEFNNQIIHKNLKTNWAWSLSSLVLSNIFYALGVIEFHAFLFFGNVFLMIAFFGMGLFFRVLHGSITPILIKSIKWTAFLFTVTFGVLFFTKAPYIWRFYLVSVAIILLALWHIEEISHALKKEVTLHLKAILYLKYILLVLCCIRVITAQDVFDGSVQYVYQENSYGLLARLILTGLNLATFVLVGGYISEKILLGEKNLVTQLNEKIIALETVTNEKEEVQQLLAERELLIASLVKAEKIAETGVLSASIAHVLSQPLCAIQMNAQSLQFLIHEQQNEAMKQTILDRIIADNQRASEIITSLKQLFTTSESQFQQISLDELIEKIGVIVSPAAKMNSITLHYALEAPQKLNLCAGELQQVIINLLNNAMQALERVDHHEKAIHIQTKQIGNTVRLMVIDNGTGIPAEMGNTIFDLMKTSKSEGMGVGLWLSRHIVKRHGGILYYENQMDRGVAFIMDLPLNQYYENQLRNIYRAKE